MNNSGDTAIAVTQKLHLYITIIIIIFHNYVVVTNVIAVYIMSATANTKCRPVTPEGTRPDSCLSLGLRN